LTFRLGRLLRRFESRLCRLRSSRVIFVEFDDRRFQFLYARGGGGLSLGICIILQLSLLHDNIRSFCFQQLDGTFQFFNAGSGRGIGRCDGRASFISQLLHRLFQFLYAIRGLL
jgi:hypothetical protein